MTDGIDVIVDVREVEQRPVLVPQRPDTKTNNTEISESLQHLQGNIKRALFEFQGVERT